MGASRPCPAKMRTPRLRAVAVRPVSGRFKLNACGGTQVDKLCFSAFPGDPSWHCVVSTGGTSQVYQLTAHSVELISSQPTQALTGYLTLSLRHPPKTKPHGTTSVKRLSSNLDDVGGRLAMG